MITVSRTFHRKSTATPWYTPDPAFLSYRKSTYVDTGKILSIKRMVSSDGLSLVALVSFIDDAARSTYAVDPKCVENGTLRSEYDIANDIIGDPPVITETA